MLIILFLLFFQRIFAQEISAEISLVQGGKKLLLEVKLKNHSQKNYAVYIPDFFYGKDETIISNCFDSEDDFNDLRNSRYKYATENFPFFKDTIVFTFPYYCQGKIYKGLDKQETKLDDIISYIYNYENVNEYEDDVLNDFYFIPKNSEKKLTLNINFTSHLRTTWALSFQNNPYFTNYEVQKILTQKGFELYQGRINSNTIYFSTKGKF